MLRYGDRTIPLFRSIYMNGSTAKMLHTAPQLSIAQPLGYVGHSADKAVIVVAINLCINTRSTILMVAEPLVCFARSRASMALRRGCKQGLALIVLCIIDSHQ